MFVTWSDLYNAGSTSLPGASGTPGTQGAQGQTGNTGPQGSSGTAGTPGPQGAQGQTGNTGPQGATGATGPQGPQGPTGNTGPQGPSGSGSVSIDAGNEAKLGSDSLIYVSASPGFLSKTAAYTIVATDNGKFLICTGGSWTLTLPSANINLWFRVRNDMGISGTIGTITLSPPSGTIDGASTLALLPGQDCTVACDGTNWRTFGLKREVIIGTQDITSSTASNSILLPSGYRYFELQFDGVVPVTDGAYLTGQISINGGSTWITTGYYYGTIYNSSSTAVAFADGENAATWALLPGGSNAGTVATQGKVIIFPCNASQWPSYTSDGGTRITAGYQIKWNTYGLCIQTGPINALKYAMSGGNIANSFLTVKGVV